MAIGASAVRAGRAFVELGTDDKIAAGLRRAQRRLRAFGATVAGIGAKLARASALLAVPFAAGLKVFADFERQMANVATMLDEPARHMPAFRTAIRDMAVEFGEATEALAGGLYDILSASIPAGKALDVLAVSVRAAKAGLTDTKTAADAITTILNSYGLSADKAASVSDLLFQVVKRGKTTFAELAPAIGMVASTAATAGVSLEELGGMIALLTRNGVRTENAITATTQTIATFLKPTAEAVGLAAELGFKLDTTTLKAEGLRGVFQRIARLPPEAIARLFPNIRALRGVLPALRAVGDFGQDIRAMGQRAGATERAYAKMTATLSHGFAQLKQAGLAALSIIGEALSDSIGRYARAVTNGMGGALAWLKANKGLVVSIAKLVAIGLVTGLSLMVLGWAIGKLAALFGLLAVAVKAAFAVLAVGKLLLAALLNPLGLLSAALIALTVGLIAASKQGRAALSWLGEGFGVLRDDAKTAFAGIAAALAGGDIALAARILWLTLKMEWQRGTKNLLAVWLSLKTGALKIFYGLVYGAIRTFQEIAHGLETGWIEATAIIGELAIRAVTGVVRAWEWCKNKLAKVWNWIKGAFDSTFDADAANRAADAAYEQTRDRLLADRDKKLAERERQRAQARQKAEGVHAATMSEIDAEHKAKGDALEAEWRGRLDKAQRELDATRAEWAAANKQAGAGAGKPAGKPADKLDDLVAQIKSQGSTGGAAGAGTGTDRTLGTFFAAAAAGLAGPGALAKRTADATERTARACERMDQVIRNEPGGLLIG